MNTETLQQYMGKLVRTQEIRDGKDFGGEGIVEKIYEEDGNIWFQVDWGYAWIITDNTEIEILD